MTHHSRVAEKIDIDLRDLSDRETEVQSTSRVPYMRPTIGRATLYTPRHLAGHSEEAIEARAAIAVEPAYGWWRR